MYDAGHNSAAITDIYDDADLQARHEPANKKAKSVVDSEKQKGES